jgi:hypothetical protein
MPDVIRPAISIIYIGSNLELDEFKNNGYVERDIHVFQKRSVRLRRMELVETTNRGFAQPGAGEALRRVPK